jgi:type VI secretion system secreted protein Hcp
MALNEMQAHAAGGGASDIFLSLQGRRVGKIKGESTVADHEDDIVVQSWRWQANGAAAINSVQATARRSYSGLTVVKGIDSATTALLSALVTNDEIKEAVLTVRKAGGEQAEFFVMTLNGGRISSVEHAVTAGGVTQEVVTINFTKVKIEYRLQTTSGGRGASTTFQDDILPGTS